MNKYLYRATCVESFCPDGDASGSIHILEDLDNDLLFLFLPNNNYSRVHIFKCKQDYQNDKLKIIDAKKKRKKKMIIIMKRT
jgi:hypothetical protein